jgi:hypothetical protein
MVMQITELELLNKGQGVQHMGYWVSSFFFPLYNYGVKGWEGYMQADLGYIQGPLIDDGYSNPRQSEVQRTNGTKRILDREIVYRRIP